LHFGLERVGFFLGLEGFAPSPAAWLAPVGVPLSVFGLHLDTFLDTVFICARPAWVSAIEQVFLRHSFQQLAILRSRQVEKYEALQRFFANHGAAAQIWCMWKSCA